MVHRPVRTLVLALFVLAAAAGCGKDDNNQPVVDLGQTDVRDDAAEPDMGDGSDANPDLPDAEQDMYVPPVDTDGDGIFDPDDNCPELENPEQADRDRDGLGDECDALPFVHDPTNPAAVANSVVENEAMMSNDTADAGLGYGLSLPFVARGSVGTEAEPGDLDFYSFEIDAPTHVLVRLTAAQSLWAGAVLLGMDLPNQNVFRAEIAPNIGVSSDREMFLPFPGRYTIVMTDARNLIESQPDVGGAGLQYNVTVAPLPLAEPELVALPSPAISTTYDGVMPVYEIDVTGVDALRVTSTGVQLDQNGFHMPTVTLYDPDADQTLAMNSSLQSAADLVGTLAIKLGDRQRLWVIDDFAQRFGNASTRLEFAATDLTNESETAAAPADAREADVNWLEIGQSIHATIGAPRAAGPSTLVGDADYFMFTARRGQNVRVTVTPDAASPLEPLVELAHFPDQYGFTIPIHSSEQQPAGQPAVVEYIMTAYVDGEITAYIQHGPNEWATNPVGGPSYGYTVAIEVVEPSPVAVPVPGSTQIQFGPGQYGLVALDATAGQLYTVSEESNLFTDMRVIDPSTWRTVAAGSSSVTFGTPTDGTYWVDFVDIIGRGTDTTPMTVTTAPLTATPIGALPASISGVLDVQPRHVYSFSGTAGDRLDMRVFAPFFSAIDVFDASFQPVGGRFYMDRQLTLPDDGTYYVAIATSGGATDPSYAYTLTIAPVSPMTETIPFRRVGVLDEIARADWYQTGVTDGTIYSFSVTTAEPTFGERLTLTTTDLRYLRGTVGGIARWRADFTGDVLVAVEDDNNAGGATFDYALDAVAVVPTMITAGAPVAGQLANGADEDIFRFSLTTGAMIEAIVTPTGSWRPTVQLLNGTTLDNIGEATAIGGVIRYAVTTSADFAIAVRASDRSVATPLDYQITLNLVAPTGAIAEVEPNDTQADAQDPGATPRVVAGSASGADRDRFRFPLVRGQRIWALSMDRNGFGTNRFDARLFVYNSVDTELTNTAYNGEGFMPALYGWQAPASGEFQIAYGARTGGAANGDYYLYFVAGAALDVAESEPNNDTASAQALGSLAGPARIAANVDMADPTDVFAFTIPTNGTRLRVALENATLGHALRVLDATGAVVAASGPGFDGLTDPYIDLPSVASGSYFVEFGAGTTSGAADVIVILD